jgi:hypothetical protein
MAATRVRQLSIMDAMILVLGTAVGAALARAYLRGHFAALDLWPKTGFDREWLWRVVNWSRGPGACVVVPMMAALLAIRLRPPRPRRGRLIHQPGFAACLAIMVWLLLRWIWVATFYYPPRSPPPAARFEPLWFEATQYAGEAVVGSWLALALSRRWRPEPSWVDRAGRVLGAYWLAALFSAYAALWIPMIQRLIG